MVALLAAEKKRLLAEKGHVTRQDFETAWDACWEIMKKEHAWKHATHARRDDRRTQRSTRREVRAAFLDEPTPFAFAAGRLSEAAGAMCLHLEPEQLGRAMLAAMAYVEVKEEDTAWLASSAANAFITGADEHEMAAIRRAMRNERIAELSTDGLTHAEIAERLDVSVSTVSAVLQRLRAQGEPEPHDRKELLAA